MSNKLSLVIVIIISLATHFAFFGTPKQVVFDEVHFGGFVSNYYDREYFFDIHPPLGKLMIAGFATWFDFEPKYSFGEIGNAFPDNKYMALRFLPTLAGSFLPIIIYFLILELGLSRHAALAGGLLIAIENAILVQSRLILMDSFLLSFGFASLLFYASYHNRPSKSKLALVGIFAGLALSIKWTGVSFLAIPALMEFFPALRHMDYKALAKIFIFLGVLPVLIYFSFYMVHFEVLSNSGSGDAFHTPEFQKTLIGNRNQDDISIQPLAPVKKFLELNAEMYKANQRLDATHPYSSQWHTWPFMKRPIYYWNASDSNAKIYFLGNPVIWWTSSVAVLSLLGFLALRQMNLNRVNLLLIGGYAVNMLPFIGVKRVMFLYHYMTALVFAVLILIYLIDQYEIRRRWIFYILGLSALIAFFYFAPLTYGTPIGEKALESRLWFESWK